jgi:hypothetical protein
LVGKVGLLPWAIFLGGVASILLSARHVNGWFNRWFVASNYGESFVFGCWIAIHLLVCLAFLAHGNWRLKRHFRALASETVKPSWWKRLRDVAAARKSTAP